MRGLSRAIGGLTLVLAWPPSAGHAEDPARPRPAAEAPHFWATGELGYGALKIGSDQEARTSEGRFSMGFKVGAVVNHAVRVGVLLDGWLIQSSDVNDPATGIGVSEVFAVVQLYPMRDRELFFAAGGGYASYNDNRPSGFDSNGWGGTIGVGYDFRLAPHFDVYPVASYSRGGLGDVRNAITTVTDRRYSAVTLRVGFAYR